MALGGVILSGSLGRMAGRTISANKMWTTSAGTALGVGGAMIGIAGYGARGAFNALQRGTSFTNPIFNNVTGQAYGKRGMDANNLNTNGLVQKMHSNRRKF